MMNAITYAFVQIHNLPPMMKACLDRQMKRLSGRKAVTTKLSFRTYNQLKAEGKVE